MCPQSTLRQAAELLSAATTLRGVGSVAAHLGFGEPVTLDLATSRALEVDGLRRAAIAEGTGLMRCGIVVAEPGAAVRQVAAQTLVRLAQRSPHVLWVVILIQPAHHTLVLAVAPAPGSHRVSALVIDSRRVQDSDAETLASMAAAAGANDVLTHHRWRELLGRDALTRRFYRELEAVVGELASTAIGRAPEDARREIALLTASRLLFLAFLEAKGWLDSDREFLRHQFDARCASGGAVHRKLLEPLFFGTLNTPASRRAATARAFGRVPFLNGGLFGRAPVERRWRECTLSDDAIGRMICGLLGSFRVTAREESTAWSEAAIDPEMLGRAFESLMASDDRRKSGAFYTPLAIIERVTAEGLDLWIDDIAIPAAGRECLRRGELIAVDHRAAALRAIDAIRVIDPACGSGAFLVHALERLAEMRRCAGDQRSTSARRREVLTRSIFGVDVNSTAVWLCELRLWLCMVIDAEERDGMRVAPLPNLDHHIRVGDALAGAAFGDDWQPGSIGPLAAGRARYTRATGARKRTLARMLAGAERRLALIEARRDTTVLAARRRDLLSSLRGRDLFQARIVPTARVRSEVDALRLAARGARRRVDAIRQGAALPFSFRTQFADAGAAGGFDVVIGNPPWVRLHRITPALRADLAHRFRSWREAAWSDGALDANTGRGFASQVDLAALFTERATQLARKPGAISLLLPAKLWTSLSAGGIRRVLTSDCRVTSLEDWSESKSAFDAVVYPSLLAARRDSVETGAPMRGAVHRGDTMLRWEASSSSIALDDSAGAPWLLLPPEVRRAFDHLTAHGERLAHSALGRPLLGVKTGCNEAFIVTPRPGWRDVDAEEPWCVRADGREEMIEAGVLRPLLRGEDIRAWQPESSDSAMIWTHDAAGNPLDRLPPLSASWLAPWRRRLEARTDAVRARRWWSLFRTESATATGPRVVWSDISKTPRACVLPAGDPTVALNSCYLLAARSEDEAHAVAVLLNSAPVAAWLCALAEPARGGYRRFLGWTLARLPVPRRWDRAVAMLAPIGRNAAQGNPPDAHTIARAVAHAYGVRLASIEPLITWCLR